MMCMAKIYWYINLFCHCERSAAIANYAYPFAKFAIASSSLLAMTLITIFLYHIHRILHIIEWYIRHNAVAEVKYKTGLILHPVEQAVDTFLNYFFIRI